MLPAFVAPLPLNSHAVLVPNVCPVCLQHGGGPDPAAHTPKLVFDFTVFDHNVAVTGGAMFLSGGPYAGHTAMDVTVQNSLFFENVAYLLHAVFAFQDFTPTTFLFDAVDAIRNFAYISSFGYIGYVDQHAHPEHEGMQRNIAFNDVLIEGPGVYMGCWGTVGPINSAGGMASTMMADGALTDVSFSGVTVRNWRTLIAPQMVFMANLDRPMTLNIDGLVIENVRGVAGDLTSDHTANMISFGSGMGETNTVHLSVEQSGNHWEETGGQGTVAMKGDIFSSGTPGVSHFRFMLSTFVANRASVGAALYISDPDGDLSVDRCSFIENVAFKKGGAIYSEGAREMTIDSSWFFNNAVRPAASSSAFSALTIFTGGNLVVAPMVSRIFPCE